MSDSAQPRYTGSNPILKWFAAIRPQLWDAPDFERVAFVLHHAAFTNLTPYFNKPTWDELTDALAEIAPEQKESWLRVQATHNDHFMKAMTFMFQEHEKENAGNG
jgi:hypothetical protein